MSFATCIVFDLDDTLYLERDYVRSGFEAAGNWASKELGVASLGPAAWQRFESGKRGDIFDMALQDVGIKNDISLVSELVRVYRSHSPNIKLAPDAATVLPDLRLRANTALITDGFSICQRKKIECLGISKWLDYSVVTDEIGIQYRKPHSRAFELIEENFAEASTRFVYVGDNPAKDFTAPRARGWVTFRIRREGGLHYQVPTPVGTSDFEIRELGELTCCLFPSASRQAK
jgi:putative hydrolase of the HAD superfamily